MNDGLFPHPSDDPGPTERALALLLDAGEASDLGHVGPLDRLVLLDYARAVDLARRERQATALTRAVVAFRSALDAYRVRPSDVPAGGGNGDADEGGPSGFPAGIGGGPVFDA